MPKPVDDPAPKLTEKQEVKATAEKTPEPQPLPKPDPIAEKLKKQDEQKEAKAEPQPLPPKKPAAPAAQIRRRQDRRAARQARAAAQRRDRRGAQFDAVARHRARHRRQAVAIGDRRAARAADVAVESAGRRAGRQQFQVTIRIRFKRDGTLSCGPQVLTSGSGAQFNAMRDSAVRAVLSRPALHHAASRALRHLEGNRLHLRHQTTCSSRHLPAR